MSDASKAERNLLEHSLRYYATHGERSAMRCALADAAALLDAYARDVSESHRRGRYIKKRGQEDAKLITQAANLIWAMREKITNLPPQPSKE